jgi:hypothetical protein
VRLVARLTIATAVLLALAVPSWGQAPWTGDGATPAAYSTHDHQSAPRQLPTAEGTWVTDEAPLAAPPEMLDAQELTGMSDFSALPYDESAAPYDESGAYGDDGAYDAYGDGAGQCDEYGDCADGCGDPSAAAGGGFGHRFAHKLNHRFGRKLYDCWCGDLWAEVHSHRRVYFQLDYLSMWAKGNPLPPLVTTSPIGTPQAQAGVLPESATTSILFGNDRVDLDQRNGGRINVGYWLVDGEFLGIEGQYFALETQNTDFERSSSFSTGDPNAIILARPFINVDPILPSPTEDSALIAFPDFQIDGETTDLDGRIDIRTVSNVQSANMTLRRLVWIDFTMQRRLDLLLGYRFFRLDDSVTINDEMTIQPAGVVPLTVLTSQDQWRSINRFHGGEIGIKVQSYHGPFQLEGIAKCAFGNNRERTWINGSHTTTVGGVTTEGEGGLLAQPTNIGSYRRDVFAVLPEADANIRMNVTKNARIVIGYTFIYMNRVQRSGSAIDRTLNPTQINGQLQGEARPAFFATDTTFWLHGWSGGFEYRW